MTLPVPLMLKPMEAEPVDDLPRGPGWLFEPKYDGFRCLAFRDGDRVDLQSKKQKSLNRFFPEARPVARLVQFWVPATWLSFSHALNFVATERLHRTASVGRCSQKGETSQWQAFLISRIDATRIVWYQKTSRPPEDGYNSYHVASVRPTCWPASTSSSPSTEIFLAPRQCGLSSATG